MSMLFAAKLIGEQKRRYVPAQKPGRSEQVVCTPDDFLRAVEQRFGSLDLDAAALAENAVADRFFTPTDDGLEQAWDRGAGRLTWVNPPYNACRDWLTKAYAESYFGAESLALVPASVGSNWWRDLVHGVAVVYLLNGRLTFKGHTAPFPKDLALLHYRNAGTAQAPAYRVWDWRKDEVR